MTHTPLPYTSAPLWILALLLVAAAAFWPGYFGSLADVSAAVHFHSLTALFWMLLLLGQSVSIHRGWRRAHRVAGLSSLALFPLFLSSSLLVISNGNAAPTPFNQAVGGRLALFDLASLVGFSWFVHQSLSQRRRTALHAGFMLATALLLVYPAAFRLLPRFVPALGIEGPDDFENVATSVYISSVATVAFAIWAARRMGRDGLPFLQAGGLIAFMAVGLATFTHSAWWFDAIAAFGAAPNAAVAWCGLALGAAIAWAGWIQGSPKRPRSA